jgi:serine/threonine protein kinase
MCAGMFPGFTDLLMSVCRSNGYTVMKEIGRGATARCYLALSQKYDEHFVVKAMPFTTRQPDYLEAQALMQLPSPNVIYLYDVVQTPHCLFLILEYCPGGSLLDVVLRDGPLHGAALQQTCRSILDGLIFIHERGCAHLDLKPANVLIDRFGRPKLADFGLAQFFSSEHSEAMRRAGTLAFIPPEVLNSTGAYDPFKVDVWAFGITAFALAAGKPPWQAETTLALRTAIMSVDITFPEETPVAFQQTIHAMLAIDPFCRPTAAECLNLPFFTTGDRGGEPAQLKKKRNSAFLPLARRTSGPGALMVPLTLGPGTRATRLTFTSHGNPEKPVSKLPTLV